MFNGKAFQLDSVDFGPTPVTLTNASRRDITGRTLNHVMRTGSRSLLIGGPSWIRPRFEEDQLQREKPRTFHTHSLSYVPIEPWITVGSVQQTRPERWKSSEQMRSETRCWRMALLLIQIRRTVSARSHEVIPQT
jgi:hypothetical protein